MYSSNKRVRRVAVSRGQQEQFYSYRFALLWFIPLLIALLILLQPLTSVNTQVVSYSTISQQQVGQSERLNQRVNGQDGKSVATTIVTKTNTVVSADSTTTQTTYTNPGVIILNGPPDIMSEATPLVPYVTSFPYPSKIDVDGASGRITKITVTLHNINHNGLPGIALLLVGPNGRSVVLMSRVGWTATNLTLTLDDEAASELPPFGSSVIPGAYRPTDIGRSFDFEPPAPPSPSDTTLSAFNNSFPNGAWSLYGIIDSRDAIGQMTNGWSINVTTQSPANILTVTNTNNSGPGSLRQAILDGNLINGIVEIHFNIPGSGTHTISPTSLSPLPQIGDSNTSMIVDASTQPGYNGIPLIELNGINAGASDGLVVSGAGCLVNGMVINRFDGNGIKLTSSADNCTITGNYIGTDVTGTIVRANSANGVLVFSANNVIGGNTASFRNIISGNVSSGVLVFPSGPGNACSAKVIGNYIGTDVSGTVDLGNGGAGVSILQCAADIGETLGPGRGNVISGNGGGIESEFSTLRVVNNLIGTDATGTSALGNNSAGLYVYGGAGTVGESHEGSNTIAYNGDGVILSNTAIPVRNNSIFFNVNNGLTISHTTGGRIERNRFCSNGRNGIEAINTQSLLIDDNQIGALCIGPGTGGNVGHGILFRESNRNASVINNEIAFNEGAGVRIPFSTTAVENLNNALRTNRIYANTGLPIDLGNSGPTLNDPGDSDSGPNELQNYPELTSASLLPRAPDNGTDSPKTFNNIRLNGNFNSSPNKEFAIEFGYYRPGGTTNCNPNLPTIYLGKQLVTTDSNGNRSFSFVFPLSTNEGVSGFITATATDPDGNTSEVGPCVPVNVLLTSHPFDFDGNGFADVAVFRPSNGTWHLRESIYPSQNSKSVQFGAINDKPVPGDYDGDGKTDIAVWRPSNGVWYVLRSSDSTLMAQAFGQSGDLPVAGDYDGDSKTDIAIYRQGNWYISQSTNASLRTQQFGLATDQPVVADFDADGKIDFAVFRPSNGVWYVLGGINSGFTAVQFGQNGDIPVPADYDGDTKADRAVYRQGYWYILQSEEGYRVQQFGLGTDTPVACDYDRDMKADIAVFRPSNGTWFVLGSIDNTFFSLQFGQLGDIPIPAAYVPQ